MRVLNEELLECFSIFIYKLLFLFLSFLLYINPLRYMKKKSI